MAYTTLCGEDGERGRLSEIALAKSSYLAVAGVLACKIQVVFREIRELHFSIIQVD